MFNLATQDLNLGSLNNALSTVPLHPKEGIHFAGFVIGSLVARQQVK